MCCYIFILIFLCTFFFRKLKVTFIENSKLKKKPKVLIISKINIDLGSSVHYCTIFKN